VNGWLREVRSRLLGAGFIGIALMALALVLGRWEEQRNVEEARSGLAAAYFAVGGRIDAPTLSGYRPAYDPNIAPTPGLPMDCLFYELDGEPYAIQLCFDARGRLVEAVDRRGGEARYRTLQAMPEEARISVDRSVLDGLLASLKRLDS
jgi:hypothetical protein